MSYNGWSNWETWNYALWLGNVKRHYYFLQDRLAHLAKRDIFDNLILSHDEIALYLAADLRSYGLVGTDLSEDDMGKINFVEIATNELDDYLLEMEDTPCQVL